MRKQFIALLTSLLFLGSADLSLAKTTSKTYAGSYKGQECSVQVNWHNWSGLGPVDGHINLPGNTTIPFSGRNSRSGVLEIEANGEGMTLTKERDGGVVTWVSPELAFTESGAGVDAPVARGHPPPARGTLRQYSGTFRGEGCNVDLTWRDGRVSGVLLLESGKRLALSGEEPGDAVLRLRIGGNQRVHRLRLSTQGGQATFVGDELSFTEVTAGDDRVYDGRPAAEPDPPELDAREQTLVGTWKGKNCTARITWKPGDDADTLRTGSGTLVLEGDMAFSLTAWQPRPDYIEFGIEPDESGLVYKTTRQTKRGGRTSWEGRFLTLSETR